MGRALSVYTVLQIARVVAPTMADAMVGRGGRDSQDRRLREFGRRVVERARIRLTVSGADKIPSDRAFIYMSNHQSHTDIPVLYATVPSRTLRMVAKTELFKVPLFGHAMRVGNMIEVNRSDRASAVESLRRAGALIADGVSVWIAPEGSRSRTGELGPLKKGGFYLAVETGTPIVPVAINGTYDVLPPSTTSMAHDCPVDVVFGAPIAVDGKSIPQLMSEVGAFLSAHVRPPRAQADQN
ncbi:MAG TPA: lysophospholipid acyltransferase family protein [Kofleriaceae bacterium]|nr:lysophospholipid acyltransferase family protein [Kofleriaceae bacterium]